MAKRTSSHSSDDVLGMVASLRAAFSAESHDVLHAIPASLDALEKSMTQVLAEHVGMADELLRAYEQLGIVFEVTRQLPTVRTEREVLHLFVQSLQTTYANAQVLMVEQDADGGLVPGQAGLVWPAWVDDALAACRDERRVVVADCPQVDLPAEEPACGECSRRGSCDQRFLRVMCGPVYAGDSFACALLLAHGNVCDAEAAVRFFDASDMSLLDSLNLFCGDLIRNLRLVAELRQLSLDVVRALVSAIEQKDEYTSGHSTRVGLFAGLLGRELGLDADQLQMLEWSALLHDIGKIGTRDEVLKKPGRLTPEEFRHIQEHPTGSYAVVRRIPQLAGALDGVVYHHEHWDGGGYPEGLVGQDIPLQARIIQVADIFDALTSTRSYRKPFPWTKALAILSEERGKTVDPGLAATFDHLIRRMVEREPHRLEAIMSISRGHQYVDACGAAVETAPVNGGA